MYRLQYAQSAERDLQAIFDYLAEYDRSTAISYLGGIEESILRLRDFPELGHQAYYPELQMQGIRILPVEKYLVFYEIQDTENTVNIIRVLHGSRNYRRLF